MLPLIPGAGFASPRCSETRPPSRGSGCRRRTCPSAQPLAAEWPLDSLRAREASVPAPPPSGPPSPSSPLAAVLRRRLPGGRLQRRVSIQAPPSPARHRQQWGSRPWTPAVALRTGSPGLQSPSAPPPLQDAPALDHSKDPPGVPGAHTAGTGGECSRPVTSPEQGSELMSLNRLLESSNSISLEDLGTAEEAGGGSNETGEQQQCSPGPPVGPPPVGVPRRRIHAGRTRSKQKTGNAGCCDSPSIPSGEPPPGQQAEDIEQLL